MELTITFCKIIGATRLEAILKLFLIVDKSL